METAVPTDLKETTDEALAELEAALIAEFDALHDAGSADIEAMTNIAEAIEAVRTEQVARDEAAAERAEAVAALAARIKGEAEGDEDETEDEAGEAEAVETVEVTEEVIEVVAEEAADEELDMVAASAPKPAPKAPSARAVARRAPAPEAPAPQPQVVITAAADVPGLSGGQAIDKKGLARALHARANSLSNKSGRIAVASVQVPMEFKVGADLAHNLDVIARATAPESLTASGWCAPSNNLYSIFGVDAGDGLIDLPTVQVTRGGLNVPSSLNYGEAADALWTWTEDSKDEEETKPCLEIPCPEFTDYRLEAEGLCLTHGNLTDRAFPELTERFIDLAINSHLHRLSAAVIAKITGNATAVTVAAVDSSAAGSILHAVDLQVADYRSQYRMSVNAVLEAVFPLWVKELMRSDFAFRSGVMLTNVTDAVLDEHFAARKVRVQFVHDYQPLYNAAEATAFPATLDFLLYPAGGYVRGDGGVIDLGVVRDSTLNATNDYTAAWTEQLFLVAQLGPAAREVTVNFSVDGVTGCCPTAS